MSAVSGLPFLAMKKWALVELCLSLADAIVSMLSTYARRNGRVQDREVRIIIQSLKRFGVLLE